MRPIEPGWRTTNGEAGEKAKRTIYPRTFPKVRDSGLKDKSIPWLRFWVLVRSRGLEPPRVAPLAPQASASTSSATTAWGKDVKVRKPRVPMMADHVTNRVL